MGGQTFNSFSDLGKSMGISERQNPSLSKSPAPANHSPEKKAVPEFMQDSADYVSIAEQNVFNAGEPSKQNAGQRYFGKMTTSKIRNILSQVSQIYNEVIYLDNDLPENIVNEIRYMKVRLVYEAGREPDVMKFCKKTELIDAVDSIGNSKRLFLRYAKYMEALVAYHRFYGGNDD